MGQVCARHTQYYEERCPYCEEPEVEALPFAWSWMKLPCAPPPASPTREAVVKAYDERLRLAMMPPNDGHGIFE